MKKYPLLLFILLSGFLSFAQPADVKGLIKEGTVLHDKGDYAGAIKKYDAALEQDPGNTTAAYEKAYTLSAMKKMDECIVICKKIIADAPGDPILKEVYDIYGSAVDDKGEAEKALDIYSEGIRKFPDYYRLYYNKGLTYQRMGKNEKAYENYQLAILQNHFHASSFFRIGDLLKKDNRIPALLAMLMQLVVEPDGDRAKVSLNGIEDIMNANIKKEGGKNVTITIDASVLDDSKKNKTDNFSSIELIFSLMSAARYDTAVNTKMKTPMDQFDLTFQLLVGNMAEDKSKHKGFFWENIVPFFVEMKEKSLTGVLSHIIYSSRNDDENIAWIKTHTEKTDEFYKWVEEYKWPVN